ncbi:hypothetical protein D4A92_07650 [Rhizobium rosettiformans]|uniref:Uncharacterized protein n=1 Tax=Rhizobium rosettiformans TaxID=1368430 RepID=A0ABX7EVB1_9HYPH|nr:hypothetical protein [Rhizobium rosettiformans]QRF51316.1 hypothetical protein D4A92_07650 [Rhizobium rosettiformans]
MNNDTYLGQWLSNASIATGISSFAGLAVGLIGKEDVLNYELQIYWFTASFFVASVILLALGFWFNQIGRRKDEEKVSTGFTPSPKPFNMTKSQYAGHPEEVKILDAMLNATYDVRVSERRRDSQVDGKYGNSLLRDLNPRSIDIRIHVI